MSALAKFLAKYAGKVLPEEAKFFEEYAKAHQAKAAHWATLHKLSDMAHPSIHEAQYMAQMYKPGDLAHTLNIGNLRNSAPERIQRYYRGGEMSKEDEAMFEDLMQNAMFKKADEEWDIRYPERGK